MRRCGIALPLVAALGCDGVAQAIVTGGGESGAQGTDDGGGSTGERTETDRDGDGVETPADCNDYQAAVYPGAEEVFDGSDNDCDGAIDEDGADAPRFAGYGSATAGGAGGVVVRVTTTADSGPGSLRAAVQSVGPTIVEFDVGGEIPLSSELRLRSFLTINGASAPEPGITLRMQTPDAGVLIPGVQEVIVTHIRVVGPHTPGAEPTSMSPAFILDGDRSPDQEVRQVVLDHVTVAQSTGGGPDVWGEAHDITISYCLIVDAWSGTSVSYIGDGFSEQRLSLHHNVWVGNHRHSPQLRGDVRDLDFVNNIVVNWGGMSSEDAMGLWVRAEAGEASVDANIIANHFASEDRPQWALVYGTAPGPMDPAGGPETPVDQGDVVSAPGMGAIWVADNRLPPQAVDRFSTVDAPLTVPEPAAVPRWPATELVEATLRWAGTHHGTASEDSRKDTAAATF